MTCRCPTTHVPGAVVVTFSPACALHSGGLTSRQRECLAIIAQSIAERGIAPSMREIGVALGTKHTNSAVDIVKALLRKGALGKGRKYASRTWTVVPVGARSGHA